MATSFLALQPGFLLVSTVSSLYIGPPGTNTNVTKFTLTNTGSTAVQVTIHFSSTLVVNSTSRLGQFTVPANGTIQVPVAQGLGVTPGGSVLAQASIDNVIIAKISGLQFTN
jgi:hypothetical protein